MSGINALTQLPFDMSDEEMLQEVQQTVKSEEDQCGELHLLKQGNSTSAEILHALNSNEDGDAWLFIKIHRGRFCYDHSAKKWFVWRDNYWEEDSIGCVYDGFTEIVDRYLAEADKQAKIKHQAVVNNDNAAKSTAEKLEKDILKRVHDLQALQRKKDILLLSTVGNNSLGISGFEWDKNPYLLGCSNGVIDLKTGCFRNGTPEDYIKTIASVDWRGIDEAAPLWEKTLYEIFDGNMELVRYIQRFFGYCLTGSTRDHVIVIIWGATGQNGKGTILKALKDIMSPIFGTIPSELLTGSSKKRTSNAPSPDIMALMGRRMVWASETEEDGRIDVSRIKWLTGSDTLIGRHPHGKNMVEFEPTHKVILMTNHKPRIPASDHAMWKRVHLVPFILSFVPDPQGPNERKCDPELNSKLLAEAVGIVAWLVRGCMEWQEIGLNPPDIVLSATKSYREDEDIIGRFLSECTEEVPSGTIRGNIFYQTYKTWCEENGFEYSKGKRFGEYMTEKLVKDKDRNGVFYKGLRLISGVESYSNGKGLVSEPNEASDFNSDQLQSGF